MTALEKLKRAFVDSVAPISEHRDEMKRVQSRVSELKQRCPDLQLECVFEGLFVDSGAYVGAQATQSAAEVLPALNKPERSELKSFVEMKLGQVEKLLAAA